ILLTRRSINPGRGLWTFPGGFVDFGESVTDAAVRETFEETGLKVDLTGLHNVYTYPGAPVIVVYRARVTGGALTTCDENDAPPAGHDVSEPHERREADTEPPHRARARPVGDGLRDEAHREHAVPKDAAHAGRPRERLVLMNRVEVPGGAGVARELDLLDRALDERWQLVAERDVLDGDLRVAHLRRGG